MSVVATTDVANAAVAMPDVAKVVVAMPDVAIAVVAIAAVAMAAPPSKKDKSSRSSRRTNRLADRPLFNCVHMAQK